MKFRKHRIKSTNVKTVLSIIQLHLNELLFERAGENLPDTGYWGPKSAPTNTTNRKGRNKNPTKEEY